jgi:hypothetical protein
LIAILVLKLSISMLLLRLVIERIHRIIIWSTTIFCTVTSIIFVFSVIFQCWPVSDFWIRNNSSTGTCVNEDVLAILVYLNATISLATDLIFTVLPIWIIWKLNLGVQNKICVSVVLCFGLMWVIFKVQMLQSKLICSCKEQVV